MLKVLELFGGIGATTAALKNLGVDFKVVDYVDIDKYATMSYNAINGTDFVAQDIRMWCKPHMHPDLIVHGSPCQDFSFAGKNAGGDEGSGTRSSLMWETVRIVKKLKPKYVIWENVKGVLSKKNRHNFDLYQNTMAELGYQNYYQVLNAKDYGTPQNRERVFTVSILGGGEFHFPEARPLTVRLKDVLEKEVDEKYYLSDEAVEKLTVATFHQANYKSRVQSGDVCRTLCAGDYKDPACVEVAGRIEKDGWFDQMKRVYNPEGISPTLTTMGGGNREPKIIDYIYNNREPREYEEYSSTFRAGRAGLKVAEPVIAASRGRNPENPSDRTVGAPTVQRLEFQTEGVSNTITTVAKDNYVVEPITTRGKDIASTVRATYSKCGTGRNIVKNITNGLGHEGVIEPGLRIRKLTPKECWRLMARSDEDFEKAAKVCSSTQLYRQAGNSIVVSVIESILRELLK